LGVLRNASLDFNVPSVNSPYDDLFYEYQRAGALRSARLLLPLLHRHLTIQSVLDIGCGAGAWLQAHQESGVDDILGLDGSYLDPSMLLIDRACFRPADITQRLELGRSYDLIQCLEVAEHVPASAGSVLVDNLVRHGSLVLFSAAVPGQGGKGHINERPLAYWRDMFAERKFRAFDFLRPRIADEGGIEWWYRYNTLLYVQEDAVDRLPAELRRAEIAPGAAIPDFAPLATRLRKMALRALPPAAISHLAAVKHRQFVRSLARG
jgi:SAM-dependent methyltransferase